MPLQRRRAVGRQRGWVLGIVLALLAGLPGLALAQGSLTYGSTVTGEITATTPFVIYAFQANAGDQVTVYAVGITPGFRPSLSLLGPDQRQIGVATGDPFGVEDGPAARLNHRIASTGRHSLLVSSTDAIPGEFLLTLSGRPSVSSNVISPNAPVTINIPAGAAAVRYSFQAPQSGQLTLSLTTSTPNFAFLARVFDPSGSLIAGLAGEALTGAALSVGPGSGFYEVSVAGLDSETQGTVQVAVSTGGTPVTTNPIITTPTPNVVVQAATSTPSICRASSSVNVNVRTGPGTNYGAIGSLYPGSALNVVGRNSISSWFVVDYNGRQGWVASSVVTLSGPCATLPFVADPPTPTPGPTSTPLPGATISFTVNGAASAVIAAGQCVTVAWNTANVQAVYYQNAGVAGTDSRQECPAVTTTYTLRVVLPGNVETTRTVTVNVGTLAPPAIATLDMSLPPDYGSTSLTAGFMPDPFTVNLTGGGNVPVAYLGGCAGYTSSAPDYSVYYTSGAFPTLRFYFMGGGSDTTMVINTATASYICADDSYGTFHPTIDINNPVSGRYDIWIGGYNANTSVSGTLYITESTSNHP